jgi:hypothetical protein
MSYTYYATTPAQNAVHLAAQAALLQHATASPRKSTTTTSTSQQHRKRPASSSTTTDVGEHDTMRSSNTTSGRRCNICMKRSKFECTHKGCQARCKRFVGGAEMYGTPLCPANSEPRTHTALYGQFNTKTCLQLHIEKVRASSNSSGVKRERDE